MNCSGRVLLLRLWGFGLIAWRVAARFLFNFAAGFALIRSILLLHTHGFFFGLAERARGDGKRRQNEQRLPNLFDDVCSHDSTF